MDCLKQPKWKATGGYTVNEEDGTARKQEDSACALHFYLAKPGDLQYLLDKRYEYIVAAYRFEIDNKYILPVRGNWARFHRTSGTYWRYP